MENCFFTMFFSRNNNIEEPEKWYTWENISQALGAELNYILACIDEPDANEIQGNWFENEEGQICTWSIMGPQHVIENYTPEEFAQKPWYDNVPMYPAL